MGTKNDRIAALIAAALLVAGGVIHLRLYFDGYRDVPNANLGRSFLLNAAASIVVAGLVVVWQSWLAPLAGLLVVNGTLLGFALSRTDRGILDFTEAGFNPRPEAALSLVVEIGAAVLLLVLLLWRTDSSARSAPGYST